MMNLELAIIIMMRFEVLKVVKMSMLFFWVKRRVASWIDTSFSEEHKVKKVKLSRYTPWRHIGRGGRRYSSYSFLTSALDGGEWSASRPGRALPPVPIG
jgi:hypothetical protein